MASIFNAFVAYQFIKTLTTKWNKMKAYDLGIIDENGKQLKKTADLETQKEKNAYTLFHRLVFNLKRILEKFPFGRSRIASYAAAFALLREWKEENNLDDMTFELLEGQLCDYINLLEEEVQKQGENLLEDAAINSVGDGSNIAGLTGVPAKFAGMPIFRIKSTTYNKLLGGKKKYARWAKYIESEEAAPIREYIRKNPKKKIVLQDDQYGIMTILRRHNEV